MALLKKNELRELYKKRSAFYDLSANLYYLIGFRELTYRRKAVNALALNRGDIVVEIGCGTGLNFSLLQQVVGPEGKIIGVDMTTHMLKKASDRVKKMGWTNVELVHEDAAEFRFPPGLGGIISTFALTLVPEFDTVIRNGCSTLSPGGKWVVLDFKLPSNPFTSLFTPALIFLTKPFGVERGLSDRQPWESMKKYLANVSVTDLYFGFTYIASGKRPESEC